MGDMWDVSAIAALIGVVVIMLVMLGLVGSLIRDGVRWVSSRRTIIRADRDAEAEW